MSRQRRKGTSFESAIVKWLRERLGIETIERQPMHGSRDTGDIKGLVAHGFSGIVEAKDHKSISPSLLEKWKAQTVVERENAGADFALLVVHKPGVGATRFGLNDCYMQIRDLAKVMGGKFTCHAGESAMGLWVHVTLEDACKMMEDEERGESL